MAQVSAGLLMCRIITELEFFLVHPGGPFYAKKDDGVWGIPKGLVDPHEDLLDAAKREFYEETGIKPNGTFESIGHVKMKSGKLVHAWAFLGEWDEGTGITSNTFKMEWPPKSGKFIDVPEADRATWANLSQTKRLMLGYQQPFLERATLIMSS